MAPPPYALLGAAALAALALAASGETLYWTSDLRFSGADTLCDGEPYYVRFVGVETQEACQGHVSTCYAAGDRNERHDCVEAPLTDLPIPESATTTYVGRFEYVWPEDCAADAEPWAITFYKEGVCVDLGTYTRFVVDAGALTTYTCSDEACSNCGPPSTAALDDCNISGMKFVHFPGPSAGPTVFATPSDPLEPRALTAPVSGLRDCHAAVGETIYGGWTVTWEDAEYCCTVRGTYADVGGPASFTGCNHQLSAEPFYYDTVAGRTYHKCFGDPDLSPTTPTPGQPLNTPFVPAGSLVLGAEPGTLVRAYAITALGQSEGAYRIDVNDDGGGGGEPDYVYCTGRGTVQADLTCSKNSCETTAAYIVFGANSVGTFCYHTCFGVLLDDEF